MSLEGRQVAMQFRSEDEREAARREVVDLYPELFLDRVDEGDTWSLYAQVTEQTIKQVIDYAVAQNLTTIRNRVNELGSLSLWCSVRAATALWWSCRAFRIPPRQSVFWARWRTLNFVWWPKPTRRCRSGSVLSIGAQIGVA
ncbi:MAG: hypothetical protein CM15mP74_04090 [Halieaceae bacterium]|nr:MAG: hypothetical protein CM15mP74_04090 [Halieaceae bacterium]